MLLGVLIAAPVLCDEPATKPLPARQAFDLTNPAIRKILRRTVATQIGQYTLAPAKDVEPAPDTAVKFVPAEPARPRAEYPSSLPAAHPTSDTLLSVLVDALIDEALDADRHVDNSGLDSQEHQDPRLTCQARGNDLGSTTCDRGDAARRISQ